jgi:hypothetical protein
MEHDLGASRAAVTGAFTIGMGGAALAALPVARWLDRRGPWALITIGTCLGTALAAVLVVVGAVAVVERDAPAPAAAPGA